MKNFYKIYILIFWFVRTKNNSKNKTIFFYLWKFYKDSNAPIDPLTKMTEISIDSLVGKKTSTYKRDPKLWGLSRCWNLLSNSFWIVRVKNCQEKVQSSWIHWSKWRTHKRLFPWSHEDVSWHAKYKDSSYVYVEGLPFDLTEWDVIAIFAQWMPIFLLDVDFALFICILVFAHYNT